jgi:hypothetical protein
MDRIAGEFLVDRSLFTAPITLEAARRPLKVAAALAKHYP